MLRLSFTQYHLNSQLSALNSDVIWRIKLCVRIAIMTTRKNTNTMSIMSMSTNIMNTSTMSMSTGMVTATATTTDTNTATGKRANGKSC